MDGAKYRGRRERIALRAVPTPLPSLHALSVSSRISCCISLIASAVQNPTPPTLSPTASCLCHLRQSAHLLLPARRVVPSAPAPHSCYHLQRLFTLVLLEQDPRNVVFRVCNQHMRVSQDLDQHVQAFVVQLNINPCVCEVCVRACTCVCV